MDGSLEEGVEVVHSVGGRDSILQLVGCTASCWESLDVLACLWIGFHFDIGKNGYLSTDENFKTHPPLN